MATGTVGTNARKFHTDQVHYISVPIVYSTAGVYTVGKVPAGSIMIGGGIAVTTAFAGGTPQTLDIGVAGDTQDFASALVITSKGDKRLDDFATSDYVYMTADTDVIATLSAGSTPSAGAGYVYMTYAVVNRAA